MDLAPLHAAYTALLADAASLAFAGAADGGWNADQVLAHMIVVDRDFASLCARSRWGLAPDFDNRASQTIAYLDAIVRAAGSRPVLIETVRRGSAELIELLATFDDEQAGYRFAFAGVDGERPIAFETTIAEFAAGLAAQHGRRTISNCSHSPPRRSEPLESAWRTAARPRGRCQTAQCALFPGPDALLTTLCQERIRTIALAVFSAQPATWF